MNVNVSWRNTSRYLISQTKFGDIVFVRFLLFFSFLPPNLSIMFLRDGWSELYITLGYDRPVYLVGHPYYYFFNLGLVYHIFGGQIGVGSNIESYGKNWHYIVNAYNLKTVKDIDVFRWIYWVLSAIYMIH